MRPRTKDVAEVTRAEVARVLPLEVLQMRPLPNRPKVIMCRGREWHGQNNLDREAGSSFQKIAPRPSCWRRRIRFAAAAIEQLEVWAERIGVEMIKGQYNADPAALCYDAYVAAERKNVEFLICDTAGSPAYKNQPDGRAE